MAMLAMLLDHAGLVFAPDEPVWRIIGRIAFPLYCFGVSQSYRYTRNIKHYLIRLIVIALFAQVPYMIVINGSAINVVGTFFVCCLILLLIDRLANKWTAVWIVLAGMIVLEVGSFEYGGYALLLMLVFRYLKSHWIVFFHFVLNLNLMVTQGSMVQMFSIIPTLWIAYTPGIFLFFEKVKVPRWIWRSFYPAHLFVLVILR